MMPGLAHSDSQPPIDDRLVTFCNVLFGSLGLNVDSIGVDRFIRVFTRALAVSGLRLVRYRIEGAVPGGSGLHDA